HGERHRVRFQRQQMPVRSDNLEFVSLPGCCARYENLPEAVASSPHGVTAPVPEIEIADHADAPRVGREHHEGNARNAVERPRVRADLVVENVAALAEQIEIEIGQDRRKSIWIFQLHYVAVEVNAEPIALRRLGQWAGKQAGLVNAAQDACPPPLVDDCDLGSIRQKYAHDRIAALSVQTQIAERVRVPSFDHRPGFGRERTAHAETSIRVDDFDRIRAMPESGTRSQSGRCASSYSTSQKAFSRRKKSSR